jgi:ABC-type hemin transport system ATPase subunit
MEDKNKEGAKHNPDYSDIEKRVLEQTKTGAEPGELTVVTGGEGVGKSTVTGRTLMEVFNEEEQEDETDGAA